MATVETETASCQATHGPTGLRCERADGHRGACSSGPPDGFAFNYPLCLHLAEHGDKRPSWCMHCGVLMPKKSPGGANPRAMAYQAKE